MTASNDNSNRRIFNAIMGDLSLSRKDFLSLLITWFRRSIWFLAFAGAYTTSPPLLFVAVSINVQVQSCSRVIVLQCEILCEIVVGGFINSRIII